MEPDYWVPCTEHEIQRAGADYVGIPGAASVLVVSGP